METKLEQIRECVKANSFAFMFGMIENCIVNHEDNSKRIRQELMEILWKKYMEK